MRNYSFKKVFAWVVVFAFLLSTFPAPSFATAEIADSVYMNGNIYTMDEDQAKATAIAVKGQKIVYVGTDTGAKEYIGKNTKTINLKGKTVLPGLIEGHMHFPSLGENLLIIDAFWKPKAEILAAVKAEAAKVKPGEWITGFGWNNTIWDDKSYPTKEDLDKVAPNNPVIMERTDGHMIWCNSLALSQGGITKDTPNPQGGEVLKDASGNPTGCLTDTAADPVWAKVPALSDEREKDAILKAQSQLFSYGFTSILDAGSPIKIIDMFKSMYQNEKLKIRLYSLIEGAGGDAETTYIANNKPVKELFDSRLSINGVKFYADGSLGARSAAMLADYSDRPGHKGNYKYTDQQMYDAMKNSYTQGYQICTHAIGDGGVNQTINTYEKLMKENPRTDARLRIEHFQVATLDDIKRIAALDIIPAMQPTHATSDKTMAEDRVGKDRILGAYAWRKVIDSGSIIVGGSDAPVEMVNPYHGLYAGVTRQSRDGQPPGGWYPAEAMTREEVLKTFTIWAAYGLFEENIKGSLEAGKLADFVVIDRDYFKCPANEIKDIQALTTVLGGEVVYQRNNSAATIIWQGVPVSFNAEPVNKGGKLYVEAAAMADKMGVKITFDDKMKTATATKDGKTVSLAVISSGGEELVPVRDLLKGFGYNVTWNNQSKSISIY